MDFKIILNAHLGYGSEKHNVPSKTLKSAIIQLLFRLNTVNGKQLKTDAAIIAEALKIYDNHLYTVVEADSNTIVPSVAMQDHLNYLDTVKKTLDLNNVTPADDTTYDNDYADDDLK